MSAGEQDRGRKRPRVLVVEDEAMVSMLIEDMLEDLGYDVAEVAAQLEAAQHAAETARFDLAIVDLNLAGRATYPVADRLASRGIPFAFVTGYGAAGLKPEYSHLPVLQKPFRTEDLRRIVDRLLSGR
jgi:CheY-like chemotaxis protein